MQPSSIAFGSTLDEWYSFHGSLTEFIAEILAHPELLLYRRSTLPVSPPARDTWQSTIACGKHRSRLGVGSRLMGSIYQSLPLVRPVTPRGGSLCDHQTRIFQQAPRPAPRTFSQECVPTPAELLPFSLPSDFGVWCCLLIYQHFPPRRARSPDGLCAAILAFCSLHTTHRPVQRTDLARVFLSQPAGCSPQSLRWPDFYSTADTSICAIRNRSNGTLARAGRF